MASIVQLKSGSWRAQVMRGGIRKGKTFPKRADAKKWAADIENAMDRARGTGSAQVPKDATVADFIEKYIIETDSVKPHGKNKKATLKRLQCEFRKVKMSNFSKLHISDFVNNRVRQKTQAGTTVSGVTIAIDLTYLSAVLKWAKVVKHYDIDAEMANAARAMLQPMGLSARSNEREREASSDEICAIFDAYAAQKRRSIPMPDIISFALASAMRQEEICSLEIRDVDYEAKTVIVRERKDPRKPKDNTVPLLGKSWDIAVRHIGERKAGKIFPYNSRSVSASFTRICKSCKMACCLLLGCRYSRLL
jgi:integrase